jgi:hypothetical protein
MITNIYKDDDGTTVAVTLGCGCCSTTTTDKEEIITELVRNLTLIERACKQLNISLTELKKIKNEQQSRTN